jgi:hypothetical protein
MDRIVVRVPESVEELCLVRVGVVVRKLRALPYAARLGRAIQRSTEEAIGSGAGHFGFLQYWSSFEALDAWSHRSPHSDWWRDALERMRKRADFGIYHETYLVPKAGVESIYFGCPPAGLGRFGVKGEAVGLSTTSRDRLGRRAGRG